MGGKTTVVEIKYTALGTLRILKKSAEDGKPLYGAVFLLYDSKNNLLGEYTTDQNGIISFGKNVTPGTYKVMEIKAPTGFVLDETIRAVTVKNGETTEIVIENHPQRGKVQILKVAAANRSLGLRLKLKRSFWICLLKQDFQCRRFCAVWLTAQPTIRGMIRLDVDNAISKSFTFASFIENLRKQGYAVKQGPNVKHMAIKPANGSKYIRLKSLDDDYTEDSIRNRLAAIREGKAEKPTIPPTPKNNQTPKRYHISSQSPKGRNKKYRGFVALYLHYLYLLGKAKRRKLPNRAAFLLREDVIKFNQYQKQFALLQKYSIQTPTELEMLRDAVQAKLEYLTEKSKSLYRERRLATDENIFADFFAQIDEATAALRLCRNELGLCSRIVENVANIKEVTEKTSQTERGRWEHEKKRGGKIFLR